MKLLFVTLQSQWKPQTTCPTIRLFTHLDANSHWPIYSRRINGCLALCSVLQHCSCSSALRWLACLNTDKASTYSRHGRTCLRFPSLQYPQTIRVTKPVGNKRLSGTKRCNQFPSDLPGGLYCAYRVEQQVFRLGLSIMNDITRVESISFTLMVNWVNPRATDRMTKHTSGYICSYWVYGLDLRDSFPS